MTDRKPLSDDTRFLNRSADMLRAQKQRFGLPKELTLEAFRGWAASAMMGQLSLCYYCQISITLLTFSLDHILPLTRGGRAVLGNCCLCCVSCNTRKGQHTYQEYMDMLEMVGKWEQPGPTLFWQRLTQGGQYRGKKDKPKGPLAGLKLAPGVRIES